MYVVINQSLGQLEFDLRKIGLTKVRGLHPLGIIEVRTVSNITVCIHSNMQMSMPWWCLKKDFYIYKDSPIWGP